MAGGSSPAIVDNLLTRIADSAVWYVLGVGIGVYLFVRGFGLLRQKRLILDIPRSTIRSAALGLIEVSGKMVGPYTLIAPLSEEECFYYRSVARLSGDSPGGSRGKSLAEETLCTPFFLDDGTGRLLIDLRGAEMQLIPLLHDESSQSPIPNYMRGFLGATVFRPSIQLSSRNIAFGPATRFSYWERFRRIRRKKSPSHPRVHLAMKMPDS